MNNENNKKKPLSGKIVGILIALIILAPELLFAMIPLGIVGACFYFGLRASKKAGDTPAIPTKQEIPFDDCPKPICFHKDKGEHHVKRGREIDPWDRPDIDISKYQRR